ncbi:MAG: hypothetical protein JW910_03085 [Anaerolineae bacterium]|nr:hypothetical protein [Anaerolineae bacterium]
MEAIQKVVDFVLDAIAELALACEGTLPFGECTRLHGVLVVLGIGAAFYVVIWSYRRKVRFARFGGEVEALRQFRDHATVILAEDPRPTFMEVVRNLGLVAVLLIILFIVIAPTIQF